MDLCIGNCLVGFFLVSEDEKWVFRCSLEIAIKVEGLSKCFEIYEQPRDRLKQFVLPHLYRSFWEAC